jgi:hypothetical protein
MDVRNAKRFVTVVSILVLFIATVVLIGSQPVQAGKGCQMVKNASDANCPVAGAKDTNSCPKIKDPNSCKKSCPMAKDPNCGTKK